MPSTQKRKTRNYKLLILLCGIFFLGGIVVFILYHSLTSKFPQISEMEKTSQTRSPTSNFPPFPQSSTDMSTWKTFTYEDKNFSFKYPPSWYTVYSDVFSSPPEFMGHFSFFEVGKPAEYSAGDFAGNEILQIFLETGNNLTISDYERMYTDDPNNSVRFYSVDTMPTVEGILSGTPRFSIIIPPNKTMVIIARNPEAAKYIEDIVSTLKFTK